MKDGIIYRSTSGFKEDWKAFFDIRKKLRLTNAQTLALLISTYKASQSQNAKEEAVR